MSLDKRENANGFSLPYPFGNPGPRPKEPTLDGTSSGDWDDYHERLAKWKTARWVRFGTAVAIITLGLTAISYSEEIQDLLDPIES